LRLNLFPLRNLGKWLEMIFPTYSWGWISFP
jgi:hypothetical protein